MFWKRSFCTQAFLRRLQLVRHVNGCHNLNSTVFACGQENCHKTFDAFEPWVQHLRTEELNQNEADCLRQETNQPRALKPAEKPTCEFVHESFHRFFDYSDCGDGVETVNFESIRNAAVRFVSKIRASSSATVSLCEDAVAECNNVVEATIEQLRDMVIRKCEGKLDPEEIGELEDRFKEARRPHLNFFRQTENKSTISAPFQHS